MSLPVCSGNCTEEVARQEFDDCNPYAVRGQVDTIYLMNIGYPVAADPVADPLAFIAEMTARVDNDSTAPNAIRKLTVIGSKPKPEGTVIELSGGRKITVSKSHNLPFKIDEVNQVNRDAVRQYECGAKCLMMYCNDTLLFGGANTIQEGIPVSLLMDFIIPEGRSEVDYIDGLATWENKFSPHSCDNPLL